MQQLKNSGNLRLIRKREVSDALTHYDVWVRNRKEYESLQVDLASQINPVIEKLIDPNVIHNAKKELIHARIAADTLVRRKDVGIIFPPDIRIAKLDESDKKALLKYFNEVILLYAELRNDNISEKNQAIKTLDLIEKNYGVN